jgi:hypothetical protein
MKPLRLNALSVLIFAFALTADLSSPSASAQSVSQPMSQTGAAVDAATPVSVQPPAQQTANAASKVSEPSSTEAGGELIELPDTPAGKTLGEFIGAFNTGDLESLKRFQRERGGDEENARKDMEFYQESGGLKIHSVNIKVENAVNKSPHIVHTNANRST